MAKIFNMQVRKNLILVLASVATFVEALDIAIINLTIPSIQEQFHIGVEQAQWLQTLYVLLFGGFLIIGGRMSDQRGRKKVFLAGGGVFMLTSLGAGLSTSFESLAIFRALQGLGAAFIMPASSSIINNTFTETQERNRAIGIFSSFAAIGSGSGLSIGGLLSTYLSWHWVFLINVPILAVTLVLAYIYFPKDEPRKEAQRVDMASAILLVLGLLCFTYGTHELPSVSSAPVMIISSILVGVLLLGTVIYRLKTVDEPLIKLSLFDQPSVLVSNGIFFIQGAFFIGFLFLISLMLQSDMGHTAAAAGLLLVPFSILSALIAKFALPMVSKRLQSAQMGVFGWSFLLLGAVVLWTAIHLGHPLPLVLIGVACISGIGITFCFTSMAVLSIRDVESTNYGVISSLTSTSYFLGGGIGLAFMTVLNQLLPSEWAVGNLSLGLLFVYALASVLILSKMARGERAASKIG
ncbi:MFS transporter [Sphingobacterium yanglingense]|uniref:MFS transporter n=2 Tax=Sphingobacterium yanglingense TaxID=1437280 RepID=A0A4R6WBC9_9SPHI|nr:MFS transporter [Sphingobacterium yanglingense]